MTRPYRFFTTRALGTTTFCLAVAASLGVLAFDDQQKPAPPAAATPAAAGDRITVPFSDPARPGRLTVGLVTGSISVKGYDGATVLVETRASEESEGRRRMVDEARQPGGLRRIPNTASGLTIEEEGNEMRIGADANRRVLIIVQVPRRTSLKLTTVNDSDIVVDGVEGDLELSNTNGDVTLTNVAGTGIVHSVNGDLKASFTRVTGKPMSFSTLNGDVDVSLPADVKANVRLDSGQGDVFTDFAVEMLPTTLQQTVEDNRSKGGKYRIKVEKAMLGRINGGGPEYTLKTYNGNIHLRRMQ